MTLLSRRLLLSCRALVAKGHDRAEAGHPCLAGALDVSERRLGALRYEKGIASRAELQGLRLQLAAPGTCFAGHEVISFMLAGDDSVWWINAALLPEGLSGEEARDVMCCERSEGGHAAHEELSGHRD